jgi:ribonucleoside-diphosphate reductase alpha chain
MSPITITKSTTVELDTTKIMESLVFAAEGLTRVNLQEIYNQTVQSLYDGISTKEILDLTIKIAENYVTTHHEYSTLASRLILQKIYKEVFRDSQLYKEGLVGPVYEYPDFYEKKYTSIFKNYLQKGVDMNLVDPELLTFDLDKIIAAIQPKRDLLFKEAGMGRIYKQYLLKTNDEVQKVFELPQFWYMRVAMGVCLKEKDRETKAIEYYNALSKLEVIAATPTLLNSGRVRNQMSSCFLLTTEDSLEHIYKSYTDIAFLSKYAGGIGVDFTNIRATGSMIKGTNGKSLGMIPFLKVLDSSTAAVNQGGVRQGAVAVYVEPWHADIFDFIASKYMAVDENRRCPNIHTVLWIPDLFMKRIEENGKWTLFSPSDVPELHELYGKEFEEKYIQYENDPSIKKETIPVSKLWEEVIVSILGKGFGHPWLTFKDPCNVANPNSHVGVVHSSNLCTEITLPTSRDETAVCNLAHINLASFVVDKKIDYKSMEKAIRLLIRNLDNVIDVNFYSTNEARNSNQRHRPVGMGTFGLKTMFEKMGVNMETPEAVELNDTLYEFINYIALDESSDLALERGKYSTFEGSNWSKGIVPREALLEYFKERGSVPEGYEKTTQDWDKLRAKILKQGLRNSQVMSIAPNRSTSYIAGTSPSIEPWDSNIFTEVGMTGKYQMVNDVLIDELESLGLWKEEIIEKIKMYDGSIQFITEIPEEVRARYKTAWEIHPKWLIAQNSRRQKWIDMAISFNMWLPVNNGKDAQRLFIESWKSGLKSTYYLHSKSKSQADKMSTASSVSEPKVEAKMGEILTNDFSTTVVVRESVEIKPGQVCDMTDPNCEVCQ